MPQIEYSRHMTPEDVAREADEINAMARKAFCEPGNTEPINTDARQKFFHRMIRQHNEFAQQYSLVLRYMIMYGMYDGGAFRKLLKYLQHNPPGADQRDYFRALAKYCRRLHEKYFPCKDNATHRQEGNRVEQEIFDKLVEQSDRFWQTAKQKQEEDRKKYREMLVNHIRNFASYEGTSPHPGPE